MGVAERMREFVARLQASRVASTQTLVGCSPDEITRLEQKYAVRLPDSYALFLRLMGHRAGNLVGRAEFDLYYPDVLRLTEEERAFWAEVRAEDPGEAVVELPADALIVCGRYGEQFQFIECSRPDDSPVFYFNHWEPGFRRVEGSVFGFLEAMRADAEHWIRQGLRESAEPGAAADGGAM
jgi:hypothetical protein